MALTRFAIPLAIFMVSASTATMDLVSSLSVQGSVACVDCTRNYDYSGTSISVECDHMKKPALATTNRGGSFKAKLPMTPQSAANCKARLIGGPKQLYALNKSMVSKVIKVADTYTTTHTMTFASSCTTLTKQEKCPTPFGSSKTFDLPLPPEFGLPPTSYYGLPFLPIIGIP